MLNNDFLIDQQEDEDLRCPICNFYFSQKTKPYLLPCNHNLCDKCIDGVIHKNMLFCPICRKDFTQDERKNFKVNYSFLNLVLKILKTKNIYCSRCQKINNWNEHHVICDEKYFKESNEILGEIKELADRSSFVLKFIDKHKNILEKSKNEIKQSGKDIICNIHNKFDENFYKTIDNFFRNIPNLKLEENIKEIKQFIEVCRPLGFVKKSPRVEKHEDKHSLEKKNKVNISCSFNNIKELKKNLNSIDPNINITNMNNTIVHNNLTRNQTNDNNLKNFEDYDTQMNENDNCSLPEEYEEDKFDNKVKSINNVGKLNAFKVNTPKKPDQFKLAKLLENQTNNFTYNFNFASNNYDKSEISNSKSCQKIIVRNDKIEIISVKDKLGISNNFNDTETNDMMLKKNSLVSKILNIDLPKPESKKTNQKFIEKVDNQNEKLCHINKFVKINQLKDIEAEKLNFSHESKKSTHFGMEEPLVNNETVNKAISRFNSTKDVVERIFNYTRQVEWTTETILNQINNNYQHLSNSINNQLYGIFDNITSNFTNYQRKYIVSFIENTRKIVMFDVRKNKIEIKDFENVLKFKFSGLTSSIEYDDNDLIFISGGKISSGGIFNIGDDNIYSNTFIIIKYSTRTIELNGQLPRKRAYHTSLYFNSKLYIVGGISIENGKLRECECYNLNDKIWELMPSMNIPRSATSLCIYNSQYLYAFRGWTSPDVYLDSIEILNINDYSLGWQIVNLQDPGLCWSAASNSSITVFNENKIFICGGQRNNKLLDECFIYDPIRKEVYRTREMTRKALFNSNGSYFENKLYMIDFKNETEKRFGCHVYEFDKYTWKINYL